MNFTAKLLIIGTLLILSGCMPMGYIQSPRVLPGVSLGPSAHASQPQRFNELRVLYLDTVRNSSGGIDTVKISETKPFTGGLSGSWLVYPRIGIYDRVRISGSGFLAPLPIIVGASGEIMVHLFDRGTPGLFRNISTGTLVSGSVYGNWQEWWNSTEYSSLSAGFLTGTHADLRSGRDLEFVLGTGISARHYFDGTGSDYESNITEQIISYKTADFAPSMHLLSKKRRFQLSAGAVVSPVITMRQSINKMPKNTLSYQLKPVKKGAELRAQLALSWRLGGKRAQARIDSWKK